MLKLKAEYTPTRWDAEKKKHVPAASFSEEVTIIQILQSNDDDKYTMALFIRKDGTLSEAPIDKFRIHED